MVPNISEDLVPFISEDYSFVKALDPTSRTSARDYPRIPAPPARGEWMSGTTLTLVVPPARNRQRTSPTIATRDFQQ